MNNTYLHNLISKDMLIRYGFVGSNEKDEDSGFNSIADDTPKIDLYKSMHDDVIKLLLESANLSRSYMHDTINKNHLLYKLLDSKPIENLVSEDKLKSIKFELNYVLNTGNVDSETLRKESIKVSDEVINILNNSLSVSKKINEELITPESVLISSFSSLDSDVETIFKANGIDSYQLLTTLRR